MEEAVLLEKARVLLRRIYTEGAPMEDILTETDEPYLSWIGPRGREFFDSQDEVLKYDRSVSKKGKRPVCAVRRLEMSVFPIEEDLAVVTAQYALDKKAGRPQVRRATLVYVRKEGKILLAHAHFSGPWELPKRNENFPVIEGRANYESVRRARELERARARPELTARRWTAALLAAAAAAGPQQEDELWWLTGGSGEHSQADPAAKNPVQFSAPGGDEETPANPEGPGEAYDGPSTVHNEEGFFVKQEDETSHGTWNSLTGKGLWVGGDGDDTGFRVDNDGNVATTGNVKMNDATATGDLKVNGDASVDGTQAAAVGGFYHFNEDVMMSVGGATAFEGDHKTAANIGVTFRVGQGSSGKRLSSDAVMAQLEEMNRKIQAMDEKINSLEQKNQDLEAENKELKAEA